MEQTTEIYQKKISFEQTYSLRTLIYYGKTMVLWKNYGTIPKTMVLYRKLWNFNLLWNKLWYYGKNYGPIVNYS